MERINNFEENLVKKLSDAGYVLMTGYISVGDRLSKEVKIEYAETVAVYKREEFNSTTIKLPAKKLITVEYILNAISKKENIDSIYINLSKYMQSLLKDKSMNVYPTSYGIGIYRIYNKTQESDKEQVATILSNLNLEYSNEVSEGGWVYRFKISKNKNNIEKLSTIS
jgi:hypothetical protein